MEKCLSPTKIFNEFGERNIDARRIIGGNTTNIMELNNLKYRWAYDLYRTMGFTNFWIPEEISMNDDKKQYEKLLSEAEKRAYELVLSFLIALDSFQVVNLKEFTRYLTAPELHMAITAQEFQEALHSYSYQLILESVVDPIKADEIYNYWRQDEVLKERIKVIAEIYDNLRFNPSIENFVKATIANYVLESLYFYSGFAFFYTLGRQGKMLNTVQQIKYINRDELTHVTLFRNIILSLKKEQPDVFKEKELEKWIVEYFKFATYHEIRWGQYVTQNKILGLNNDLIEKYIKYLADLRITQLGFKPIYHITENPLPWIDQFRTINNTKTDFFQKKPQTYAKRNELRW